MSLSARWACLACGHQTIEAPPPGPPGTCLVCPVCRWKDVPPETQEKDDPHRSANGVSLREAQRNVLAIGAIAEWRLDEVRAPLPEEERASNFRTLDELAAEARAALLAEIDAAFDGVSREGGVSLHETEPIDNYEGDTERQAARALDTESRWQDVPHADLAEVCGIGGIAFFDPIGWRYYLPAYMTWWLSGGEESGSFAAECLIYSLKPSQDQRLHEYDRSRYTTLDRRQASVVMRFLKFVERFEETEYCAKDARTALAQYWLERSQ